MPERFTKTFAQRLDRLRGLAFQEAEGVQRLVAGSAFVCPGGKCVEVIPTADQALAVSVVSPAAEDRYVPSCDRLFESAAKAAGPRVIAVVLTGMGDDGARGIQAVKEAGGLVLAEAPETAVIYGMPGAAVRTGLVDRSLPLHELSMHLATLVR
jgi:two-component system chemotaxis response regulator CheB